MDGTTIALDKSHATLTMTAQRHVLVELFGTLTVIPVLTCNPFPGHRDEVARCGDPGERSVPQGEVSSCQLRDYARRISQQDWCFRADPDGAHLHVFLLANLYHLRYVAPHCWHQPNTTSKRNDYIDRCWRAVTLGLRLPTLTKGGGSTIYVSLA